MKVLFCTDGSRISYNAILNFSNWGIDCTIDVLNVFDLRYLPDFISLESENWKSLYENSSEKILDFTEIFFKDNNLLLGEKIKKCGSTVDNIQEIMSEYDFIVMGSNGKKGIQKWLGSVSQEIATVSDVPVYISKGKNESKKVLFAVDGFSSSFKMIKNYIMKLDLKDKDIYIANVYEIPEYLFLEGNLDFKWINDVSKKQEKESKILLNNFELFFQQSGYEVEEKFILKGNPAQEIIKLSNNYKIDLVVTGSENRKKLSKAIFGSTSLRVLGGTKSDLLIIKK